MDKISDAKEAVINAARRWYREILRQDVILKSFEEDLFGAIMYLHSIEKDREEFDIPFPPKLPSIEYENVDDQETVRYSDVPTAKQDLNPKNNPPPKQTKLDLTEISNQDIFSIIEEIKPSR